MGISALSWNSWNQFTRIVQNTTRSVYDNEDEQICTCYTRYLVFRMTRVSANRCMRKKQNTFLTLLWKWEKNCSF